MAFPETHTSHPEVSTAPYGREDYPQSLWEHPEPDIDETINLGDVGLDDGDTIDGYLSTYLDEGVRLEIPPGTYRWNRGGLRDVPNSHLVGLGGLGDVVFDHSGASSRVQIELDHGIQVIENIDVVGYADPDRAGHRVAAHGVDTEIIFKRFRTVDGTTPDGSSSTNGFYMDSLRSGERLDDGHSGTLRFLWCQLTRYGDNGLYCDGPIVDDDARGQVIVVGGEYRYNNISNIRLGHYGHTVYGARITATQRDNIPYHSPYNQQRGIRIRQPEPNSSYSWLSASDNLIDQCEFYYPSGAGGAGMFVIADETDENRTSGRLLRCRFENHSSVDPIADDHGSIDGAWQAWDCHIYGSGDLSSDLTLRGDSVVGSGADEIMEEPWWGADVLGLSSPPNLRVIDTSPDSITVAWDRPSLGGDTSLDRYDVYLDGEKVDEEQPGTTTTTIRSLRADTQYDVGVTAVSTDGNESVRTTITATTDDVIVEAVDIGGGDTYPFTVAESDADVTASTLSGLTQALEGASEGDVVFLEADVEIESRDDALIVPPGVTLASDRGVDGANGARIYKDSWSGFGSGQFYGLVRARADSRVTGLRVEGNIPTTDTWYDASEHAAVADAMDAGIRALADDVEIDNCEVYTVAAPIANGADNVDVHHCHLHDARLYDSTDHSAAVSFGIHTEGAPAPEPTYRHNLIEHCRLPFGSSGDGGFVARHNIIRGPILQPTVQVGAGGGTTATIRNVTAEEFTSDLTSDQLPNVRVYDVPDESVSIEDSHFHNPDSPVDSPTASDTDNAIVQVDSGTGDAIAWDGVAYSGNHYGSSDPPSGVGAFPLGAPGVISRPDSLSISEGDHGEVTLDWNTPQNVGAGLERYNIYIDGRIFTEVDAPPAGLSVATGTEHRFEVTAVDTDEVESFPSSVTFTTSSPPPTAPTSLVDATKSSNSITVQWDAPSFEGSGLSHYRVLRNNDHVADVEHTDGQTSYAYTHDNLDDETVYDLSVRAVDVLGVSSDRVSITASTSPIGADAPDVPELVTRDTAVSRVALEIVLPEDYDSGVSDLSHFDLYRDGVFQRELDASTTLFIETGLDPRRTYTFNVRAVNGDGYVSPTATTRATTLEPGTNHRGTPIDPTEDSCGFGDVELDVGPSQPQNLRFPNLEYDNFVVRWDEPEDVGAGIDYYNVYADGVIEAQTSDTEAVLTFPRDSIGVTITFDVEAVDLNGISSGQSSGDGVLN